MSKLVNSRNKTIKDISGIRFTRLTAISYHSNRGKERRAFWTFKCDCGEIKVLNRLQVEKNKTKSCGCLKLEKQNQSIILGIYKSYKQEAKVRKIEFDILEKDFYLLIQRNCVYSGHFPTNIRKSKAKIKKEFKYNGLDRVDSNKGYILNNVVPCCKICNRAKSDLSEKDWEKYLKDLTDFRNNY